MQEKNCTTGQSSFDKETYMSTTNKWRSEHKMEHRDTEAYLNYMFVWGPQTRTPKMENPCVRSLVNSNARIGLILEKQH